MKASARLNFSTHSSRRFLALAGAVLLGTTAIILPVSPAEASFSFLSTARNKQARGRVPGRRRGGARRGTCAETQTQLVALISATEVETETLPETYVGGVTAAGYPTFWFDVPYALTDKLTAEFVLQDEQGQEVYRTTSAEFSAAGQTPGAIGISLSKRGSPLEAGQTYQWYFKIDCGSESPLYVQGGIERVALSADLVRRIEATTPLEQAALYQENDIWYDAVDVIAQLRQTQPNNSAVRTAWINLMRSLGL